MMFPVVIHKEAGSDFGVTVPDLPGCFSAGASYEAALELASEAVACHVEGLLADGEAIPIPKSIAAHRRNPDYRGGVWALVTVDLAKLSGKAQRINITLPARALVRLDRCAKSLGETRSGLILRAALEFVARN